jgi:hypothetical protein
MLPAQKLAGSEPDGRDIYQIALNNYPLYACVFRQGDEFFDSGGGLFIVIHVIIPPAIDL